MKTTKTIKNLPSTSIKFSDLSKWDQLLFHVIICTELGELPSDHGITVEAIDFMIRRIDERGMCPREKPFISYADGDWIWKFQDEETIQNI